MTAGGRPFVRRVAGVFSARVGQFAIGITTSFLLSRLLGPAGRGAFALATLVPSTLFALGQLGLPSAFGFFAGRGSAGRSLLRTALLVAGVMSALLLLGALLALPALEATALEKAPSDLVRIALFSLPFQFFGAFCGAILIGRQTFMVYNVVLIGQSALSLMLVILLVGLLDLGPLGAVIGNLTVAGAGALAMVLGVRATSDESETGPRLAIGQLGRYGLRLYPASVTSFFSYRVDIFLLGFLLVGSPDEVTARVGLYTLAVSLAELTFFVPDSVATVFFPRIAGSERRNADEMTPMVSRMTVLVTLMVSVALIPAAFVAVHLILPNFTGSLPAFLVLLPGVVALAVAKVLSSYVSGIGQPLPVALAATIALATNVIANLLLIPPLGIVGASLASVISYSLNTATLVVITTRLSRRSPLELLVPSRAEARRLIEVARGVWRRVSRSLASRRGNA
jgi:stage V sporulation protein B